MTLEKILNKEKFDKDDLIRLLSIEDHTELEQLRVAAYETMLRHSGDNVYFRGLIEFSNVCTLDCLYCGIRRSNKDLTRYTLSRKEIVDSAMYCAEIGYGSLVLQSGERRDDNFIAFLTEIITEIKTKSRSAALPEGLGITLSVGEQTFDNYQRLFNAGAHRYLLRIEASNPKLFAKIHPAEQQYATRLQALKDLKAAGFQLGTGVMIGIPGQTIEDLASDIMFFKEIDADMIGMGPYITHHATPMCSFMDENQQKSNYNFQMALKMIAVTRLYLKDVNIASTTALQALDPLGREEGLRYGANVVMPQATPLAVRNKYLLYEGKPCTEESTDMCFECLVSRVKSVGRTVGLNEWGDSIHFRKKTINVAVDTFQS
jgi:biotin synthase